MAEKEWLGADLIFDLDADHIVKGAYDMMLARVKEDLYKLIDMLTGELGFSKHDLKINFSGGRGYHIHIPTLAVRSFSSAERRELVNYVSGTGLSLDTMLSSPKADGWQGRYRAALSDELERIQRMPALEARAYLSGLSGISEKSADYFYKSLGELRGKFQINPESLRENKVIKALTSAENEVFQSAVLEYAAQADEPVTTDIKRLIRHPGSLHGGSGMRVTPIPLEDLDDFDPLIDAVVFGEDQITVTTKFKVTMPILGNTYEVPEGTSKVPEALAVFLCARGIAELGGA
jgi:DNA primase small subunit